jgi:hypothetical protein
MGASNATIHVTFGFLKYTFSVKQYIMEICIIFIEEVSQVASVRPILEPPSPHTHIQ